MLAHRWTLVKLGMIVGSLLILYASVLRMLIHDWIHLEDFSHGFLIPLVSLYFVYERRKQITAQSPHGHWVGLAGSFQE